MDANSRRKIIENTISVSEGLFFQQLANRLCSVLYPDFTRVRSGGPLGDESNDGYCFEKRIFFAAHATRGEKLSKTKTKIKDDLENCLEKHPDVKTWTYLTNQELVGEIHSYIDELRKIHQKISIETWDHAKIAEKILALKPVEQQYIVDINFDRFEDSPKGSIEEFKNLIRRAKWHREFIDNREFWICEKDSLFQIENVDDYQEFTESWTQVYPDKFGSGRHSVNLNIHGVTVKQLLFIYCDGGRISVPMPEVKPKAGKLVYFWKRDSIEFELGKLIGSFYIYEDLEGIAKQSSIELV